MKEAYCYASMTSVSRTIARVHGGPYWPLEWALWSCLEVVKANWGTDNKSDDAHKSYLSKQRGACKHLKMRVRKYHCSHEAFDPNVR